MTQHPADTADMAAELAALRRRLTALEAGLAGNAAARPSKAVANLRVPGRAIPRLAGGALLAVLAGASVVYGADTAKSLVDALFISDQGRVGIGTAQPAAKLHVAGDGWFGAAPVADVGADAGAGLRVLQGPSEGVIQSYDHAAGSPRSLILQPAGGNVGIGAATSSDRFQIDGGARMKSLKVDGTATIDGVTLGGKTGRNMFVDTEGAGALRVGAAWGVPGIYAESGEVIVGGVRNVWLHPKVAITGQNDAAKRAAVAAQGDALYVEGGIKSTATIDGNMKVLYQRDDQAVGAYQKPNWRYHMSLTGTAYAGKTKTIPIDILRQLCGKQDGCEVRLGMTRWDAPSQTEAGSRSVVLYYAPSISGDSRPDNTTPAQWAAGRWRTSNDKEGIIGDGVTKHVLDIWDTCILTDGSYDKFANLGDLSTGLQMLVWNGYKNANRTCELTLIP